MIEQTWRVLGWLGIAAVAITSVVAAELVAGGPGLG